MQLYLTKGFPGDASGKETAYNAEYVRDMDLISGWGRFPGGGYGNPLQYSHLENPMDRGAWWVTVHGVTKSQTQPSDLACIHAYLTKVEGKNLMCC